ncbi:MAG: PIN domain-containing protein [Planctomycetota bacterium]|nr:PIN domain-containing protein [Planctomycetota bacterium]
MAESLIVDANPLLSALLGGTARDVILSGKFSLYSTQHTLFEVEKYLPLLAHRLKLTEMELFREFLLLPIIACQPLVYDLRLPEASQLIGHRDPKDVQILALTLQLGYPIWTEDRDFDDLPGIVVRKTADLLTLL